MDNDIRKLIWDRAKKYYPVKASHGLNHIQDNLNMAKKMLDFAKEPLTDQIYAAIVFHDSGLEKYGREIHEVHSAEIAKRELKDLFNSKDLFLIAAAIREHRASFKGEFTSMLSDICSSADRNAPNFEASVARSFLYTTEHHPEFSFEEKCETVATHLKKKYGSNGYARFPIYYSRYYGKDLTNYKRKMDGLNATVVEGIVGKDGKNASKIYDASMEEMESSDKKESVISLIKFNRMKFTEDDLKLILDGINLAADASNDPKWSMQDLRKYLEVKPNIFFIKKEEEKIGIVFLGIDGGHNEIGNFAIFKKYQGKGYGLQALKVIIDYLRKLHPGKDIEIGVAEKNTKAVNLYKKVGFKITKTGEEKSGRFYRMTLDAKTSVSVEGYSETATEISGDYNQWIGEYMYHGSSSKFTTLEPQTRNNRTTSTTKPKIFFTPFKGFAGFFCIDQNDELLSVFGSDYDKESIVVLPKEMPVKDKDGNYDLSQFQQVDTNIAFRHNVKEFKSKFTKRFVGYIHFVKTDKLISSGLQEHVFHGMPEYWYYKSVQVDKVERVEITATFEYDSQLSNKVGVAALESLSDKVASNIVNDKVYHASPKKFDVISGKKSNTPNAKSSVFVSPFKHFASMFILDFQGIVDQIEEQIDKKHIRIDNFGFMEWNETPRSTASIPSKVHVLVRTPENFKPFKGKATGYMYTIDFSKYKDQANMWSKAKDSDVEFTIHGDVKPEKCEQISYEYEVLKDTKQYNHAEESMSNTAQENFGVKDDTFVRDVILPAIKDDTLYHGSSQKLSVIKPFQLKELRDKNVKTISLTPYARLASLFCVPFRSIRENSKGQVIFHHCRMKLDEWFEDMPEDEMYKSVQTVHVSHNIKQLEPIDKTYTGYLHYVHAEDALVDAGANPINGKGPYEVVSYVKELKPYKVETIKIRMIAKYSPSFAKECGLDAEPCEPEDVATESLTIEPDTNPAVRIGLENFWDESKPVEYRGKIDVNGVEHLHFVHGDETNQALSVMVVHSRERKDNCGPVRVVYEFDKFLVRSTEEQTDLDVAAELLQEFNAGIEEFNHWVRSLVIKHLKDELNDEQVNIAVENMALENVIADTVKGIFKKIGEFISWFLRKLKDLWNYFFGKTQRATRALKAANDKITRHKNSNGFFNDAAFESAQAPQNLVNAVGLDSFVNMGFVPDAFNAIFNEMLNMWANEPQDLYEEVFVKYSQAPTTHRWHPIVAFMPTGGPNSTDAITYTKNRYKSVGSMRDSAYDRDSVLILLEEVMKVVEAYEKNSKLIATKGNIASEAAKRTMEYQDRTDVTEHEAIQMAKDIQELGNYLQVVFKCYQKAFEFILEQTGIVTGIYMKYMK